MVRAHVKFVGLGNCDPARFPGICTPALPRRDSIEQLRKGSLAANVRGWLVTLRVCTKLGCSDAILHDWWICNYDQFGKSISLRGKSRRPPAYVVGHWYFQRIAFQILMEQPAEAWE
jgi:hypothetical protein